MVDGGLGRASALSEDLGEALRRVEGEDGARALRRALRELELDGETALAIAGRLAELEREFGIDITDLVQQDRSM